MSRRKREAPPSEALAVVEAPGPARWRAGQGNHCRRKSEGPLSRGPSSGGGAGNRTRVRASATCVIHAARQKYPRFVPGWTRLVPVGSFEKGEVAGHTRNM